MKEWIIFATVSWRAWRTIHGKWKGSEQEFALHKNWRRLHKSIKECTQKRCINLHFQSRNELHIYFIYLLIYLLIYLFIAGKNYSHKRNKHYRHDTVQNHTFHCNFLNMHSIVNVSQRSYRSWWYFMWYLAYDTCEYMHIWSSCIVGSTQW